MKTEHHDDWVADTSLLWNIALQAEAPLMSDTPLTAVAVSTARAALNSQIGTPDQSVSVTGDPLTMLCGTPGPEAVRSHLDPHLGGAGTFTVVAQHRYLDGLGLLGAFGRLVGTPAVSNARGLGETPEAGFAGAALRRLAEVAFTPPAVIAASGGRDGAYGDVFARLRVEASVSSAQAAFAAARAVGQFNHARGARARHVAVAVGASRRPGDQLTLTDSSALLRLVDVERLDSLERVKDALREASPAPAATGEAASGMRGRLISVALRLLGSRLGSSVLISHLGEVECGGWRNLAFYPVTGGTSGLSIGLVGQDGSTTVTARARAERLDATALGDFLGLFARHLPLA